MILDPRSGYCGRVCVSQGLYWHKCKIEVDKSPILLLEMIEKNGAFML